MSKRVVTTLADAAILTGWFCMLIVGFVLAVTAAIIIFLTPLVIIIKLWEIIV